MVRVPQQSVPDFSCVTWEVDAIKLNAGPRRADDGLGAEPCRIEDKDFVAEFDGKKYVGMEGGIASPKKQGWLL